MKLLAFICVATQLFQLINSKTIDVSIPEPCSRLDPDLKNCFRNQVPKIMSHIIKHGIPEYGVIRSDPFELPLIAYDITENNLTSIKGSLKDLRVVGLLKYTMDDINFSFDENTLTTEVLLTYPDLYTTADIKFLGKIFNVPLEFEGAFKGNGKNVKFRIQLQIETVIKNGAKRLVLKKMKFKTAIGDFHIGVTAANPQDQALIDVAMSYINGNTKALLEFANPYYEETAADWFKPVFEKIVAALPAEKMFPE